MQRSLFHYALVALVGLALVGLLSAETTASSSPPPFPDQRDSLDAAVQWLFEMHQNHDGGYSSFSGGADMAPSDMSGTLDALLAIGATGYHPGHTFSGTVSPVQYLLQNSADLEAYAASGGTAGKTVLGLASAHQNPYDFAGFDYVGLLLAQFDANGTADATPYTQSLAMLGVAAANAPMPANADAWLISLQGAAGAWEDGFGTTENADATALALMALAAAGYTSTAQPVADALAFLASSQQPNGGWEYGPGFGVNANSTGLVLQALSALGEDFYTEGGNWDAGGNSTPLAALLDFQNDSGAFQSDFGFGPFDDFYATVQAMPAVSGKPYAELNIAGGRGVATHFAVACLDVLQDDATSGWEQFSSFGVNAAGTSRAIQALVAAGVDLNEVRWAPAGFGPLQALANDTPTYIDDGGLGGRPGVVAQGVVAAGGDPTAFAGYDLPVEIAANLDDVGRYADVSFGYVAHGEAMLGLTDSGALVDQLAVDYTLNEQSFNGTWGDTDSTGIMLHALADAGIPLPATAYDGLYLLQNDQGGWGASSNPNSTSEVVQGLWAYGEQPFAPVWSVIYNGRVQNASDALLKQQLATGCWPSFSGSDGAYATTDALLMMAIDRELVNYRQLFLPLVIVP